ncbi:Glutathione S-transferase, putative [Pseudomonas chlororaphis]|uniref:glutathione S-transferase family protein n=1 Tax=Pseudomonas chlororaphis TaxID=587753 RepID=UPI000F580641|nr:glutathione S-transferase family protein [Pseudomonas chlororaphis]AZD08921.1 Glutathione S-transferase, putative [Pseudomonas chlororaphis]
MNDLHDWSAAPVHNEGKSSMSSAPLTLYELAGADPDLRFSPHCWKTRMALAHKGLQSQRIAWRFSDKARIAFSRQGAVPVLVDGDQSISDSWRIALHLEQRYPERPSLFGGREAIALATFVNRWADSMLLPAVARVILLDVYEQLAAEDRAYFRSSREAHFGTSLEQLVAPQAQHLEQLRQVLAPLRQTLKGQPFLAGEAPAYADYCVFGMFMWARCTSSEELLGPNDALHAWRERLLDAFGGLARAATLATPLETGARHVQ